MFLHLSVILFTGEGGLCQGGGGFCSGGFSVQGVLCQGDPRRTSMVTCRQYASYWNAYLFCCEIIIFVCNQYSNEQINKALFESLIMINLV